jgi:hypothetical protein
MKPTLLERVDQARTICHGNKGAKIVDQKVISIPEPLQLTITYSKINKLANRKCGIYKMQVTIPLWSF